MKRSSAMLLVVGLLVVLPVGYRAVTWLVQRDARPQYDEAMTQAGRELFVHEWTPSDALSPGGDGLGPMFNANSCVACHSQAGVGGGGPLAHNVTVFTFATPKAPLPNHNTDGMQGVVHSDATMVSFAETLRDVAPGFPSTNRPALADLLPSVQPGCVVAPKISAPGISISQRNTPALFGANLIDAIPDRLIIANERMERLKWGLSNSETEDLPVGRALRLANGHIGRFGWKAQIGTLSDFVRAACANELGLGNPSNAQPVSLTAAKKSYRAPGLDLTDAQCDQITAFVASLPRPVESQYDPSMVRHVAAGKEAFHAVGCAECHTPDLGEAKGIYSDLLLHRMGKELVGGGSYGDPPLELPEFPSEGAPQPSEWRTPPLWGVADSAPYLHDGRAATLEDAIVKHAGQAKKSADRYRELPADQQNDLVAFLRTLRAPAQVEPSAPAAVAQNDR